MQYSAQFSAYRVYSTMNSTMLWAGFGSKLGFRSFSSIFIDTRRLVLYTPIEIIRDCS